MKSSSLLKTIAIIPALELLTAVNVSALTYQDSAEMQFTFNPTISVSLSSPDLIISNLTPGSASDSNIVTATVSTNAGWGYYLAATTGTAGGTTNLVNTTDNAAVFTSLASNVATVSAMPDNSWGYSYSTDNGTTWVSGNSGSTTAGYNGLPLDADDNGATGIKLLSSNTLAASGSVQFKIGAHAGTTQAAGTYTGTVNFYAVTNPAPDNTMQGFAAGDASTTCSAMSTGDTIKLKDSRNDTEYTVGKLADGKCWMVENLNLAGGSALSAENTDVDATYINSFTTSNNLTKNGNTIVLPASSTSGFSSNNYSYVYNSGNKENCGASGQNTPCYSYYSWDAATLGSGRTLNEENTDAPYSICPKGWRLPTSGDSSNNEWKRGDFYALAKAYGANLESSYYDNSSATGANFYNNAGPNTTVPNFLLAGLYVSGSFYDGGSNGRYWSSTSGYDTSYARYLSFFSSSVYSANYDYRRNGFSVRCLFQD